MVLDMSTSLSMALSFAGSLDAPNRTSSSMTSRPGSVRAARSRLAMATNDESLAGLTPAEPRVMHRNSSLPRGGWKARRPAKVGGGQAIRQSNVRKWDGAERRSSAWDGLRRDPELWFPDGNCYVHLYGRGQSRRGPAFKIHLESLVEAQCNPLLSRCMSWENHDSPSSDHSSHDEYDAEQSSAHELYISAPKAATREESMLHHVATRNFFAWLYGRSLVGAHLGGALVGLLNSMDDFRSEGAENVRDVLDYMDEEGYADMRNHPDHALAILYFAESFRFRDLYIDAYAHCVGMDEKISRSPEYEYVSQKSCTLIGRARLEMDARLDGCGRKLRSFLEDDLSSRYLDLSAPASSHLDHFRSFLHAFYVAKLGYYPPPAIGRSYGFPKEIYAIMYNDFECLYEFLANMSTFADDNSSEDDETRIVQNIQSFDGRHAYTPLVHPLPLLPELAAPSQPRAKLRFGLLSRSDKLKPDERMVALAALHKATNSSRGELLGNALVRAYRGFEKATIFPDAKSHTSCPLPLADARKVRWMGIYTILQTLRAATEIPVEVRDTQNVGYSLCIRTDDCLPWDGDEQQVSPTTSHPQSILTQDEEVASELAPTANDIPNQQLEDLDFLDLNRCLTVPPTIDTSFNYVVQQRLDEGVICDPPSISRNVPELKHPKPQRLSFHEVLGAGYGHGLNDNVLNFAGMTSEESTPAKSSFEQSHYDEMESDVSAWSNSENEGGSSSPASSVSELEGRSSHEGGKMTYQLPSEHTVKEEVTPCASEPLLCLDGSWFESVTALAPAPLRVPVKSSRRSLTVAPSREVM